MELLLVDLCLSFSMRVSCEVVCHRYLLMRVLACHRRRICLSLRDSLGEPPIRATWAEGGLRRETLGCSVGAWLGEPHRLTALGDTHHHRFHLSLITLGGDLIIICFSTVVSST